MPQAPPTRRGVPPVEHAVRARRSPAPSGPGRRRLRYPGGVLFGLLEIATVCALVGGGVAAALRRRRQRQPRTVRGAPRVAIADAGEGRVTCVVGELVDDQLLTAPITGRRCAHWTVEVARDPDADHLQWLIIAVAAAPSLVIEDGTGRALVELGGADLVIDRDAGLRVLDVDAAMGAAHAWLRENAWRGGATDAATYRVREGALGLEDPIAVVGMGVREPDLDAPRGPRLYRDGPPTRLHLSSTPTHRLFVTDAPAATGR